MILDYTKLALNNLRRRGLRSWLTMLGIFIGIAAVIALISLGQGLKGAITGQFSTLSTDTLTVTNVETGFGPPGSTAVTKLNDHDLKLLESVPGVQLVIPRLIRFANIEYNSVSAYKYLGSIPDTNEKINEIYNSGNLKAEQGRLLGANDRGRVVLGNDFLSSNNDFGKEIKVGSQIKINGKDFQVVGILKKASTFILNGVVLMSEQDMDNLLNINKEYDLFVVKVEDSKETEIVAQRIKDKMRTDRKEKVGQEDFNVQTPVEALSSVSTLLNIVNLVVSGIAAISLLIGSIGIANTMFTSVIERTKEIGIMKAIGAKNEDIMWIFLLEAGLLGLVGGIVGVIIGLGLAFSVSAIATLVLGGALNIQVNISWFLVFGTFAFSLIIGIISGIIPALQAARLRPVEALRK